MAHGSSAGTTIKISSGVPATFDQAGYSVLSYTKIGKTETFSAFGRVYEEITFKPLDTRATQKFKGSFDEGGIDIKMALDDSDAGQLIVQQALDSDSDFAFEVSMPGKKKRWFQGKVLSFPPEVGSSSTLTMITVRVSITTSDTGVGIVKEA